MSYGPFDPSTVSYPMASSIYAYFKRCIELGAFELEGGNSDDEMTLNPDLADLVRAIHRVLAGGKVQVTVTLPGSPDVFNDLEQRFRQGLDDANTLNLTAGYYVSVGP